MTPTPSGEAVEAARRHRIAPGQRQFHMEGDRTVWDEEALAAVRRSIYSELVDLFPGTGVMERVLAQGVLPL